MEEHGIVCENKYCEYLVRPCKKPQQPKFPYCHYWILINNKNSGNALIGYTSVIEKDERYNL